jgi:hypothetical protein
MTEYEVHVSVTALENNEHRFPIHLAQREFPGPRPAVVVEEVGCVGELPCEPIENVEPGVGADQFAHAVPVASIKAIHIESHDLC